MSAGTLMNEMQRRPVAQVAKAEAADEFEVARKKALAEVGGR